MLYSRKYKNSSKDGRVVVSISNLFHLLDLSRKKTQEDSNILKPNIHTFISSEHSTFKDKETIKDMKTSNNEIDIESKQSNEKDIKTEESKDLIIEKENVIKNSKDNVRKTPIKKLPTINRGKRINTKQVTNNSRQRCCDYFNNIVIVNFLLLIFNNCILWIFCYMISAQKNESYCYNHYLKEFEICVDSDYCPSSGIHDFIYINDDKLSDVEIKNEINNINKNFFMFYNYESKIFSKINKKFIKIENTLSKYSITIILTKNENYLFNNTFRVGCESYLLGILIMIGMASIIGTFIFGLLADIFGRKKILIIVNIFEIIGGITLFLATYFIKKYNKEDIFREKFNNDFINTFAKLFDENNSFIKDYISNFIKIKEEVLKTKIINDNFKNSHILIFGSIFLIFLSNSSIKIISLSYMLENALTQEKMSLYFLFFSLSQPISIFLSTIMVIYLNSFEYPILICSIIILILTLLILIFFFESQRFNFEYCFYTRITEFTEYIIGKEELKKNYRVKCEEIKNNMEPMLTEKESSNNFGILYSTDDYRIQSELNNEKINQNTYLSDAFTFSKNYFYNKLYSNKMIKQYKSKNLIERINIYQNPIYIIKLIFKNKHIKKKINIILSFIINLSIVINLPLQRITSYYFLQREKLISKTLFINYLFLCLILMFIILFPFVHYLTKCFGIYAVLFPFLILITIGAWFFEFSCFIFSDGGMIDLTIYDGRSDDQLIDKWNKYLLPQVFINSISLVCLDYVLYFIILKLTKTIYRCSALALAQILYNLSFIIGIGLERFIKGGYYYAGIFSIIAFINSFFINSSEDSLNISEMREIRFDENKNKDK